MALGGLALAAARAAAQLVARGATLVLAPAAMLAAVLDMLVRGTHAQCKGVLTVCSWNRCRSRALALTPRILSDRCPCKSQPYHNVQQMNSASLLWDTMRSAAWPSSDIPQNLPSMGFDIRWDKFPAVTAKSGLPRAIYLMTIALLAHFATNAIVDLDLLLVVGVRALVMQNVAIALVKKSLVFVATPTLGDIMLEHFGFETCRAEKKATASFER